MRTIRALIALLLAFLCMPSVVHAGATGVSYPTALGHGLRNPTQGAFRDDILALAAYRRTETPVFRTNNIYVSKRGNDTTGDGKNGVPLGSHTGGNISGSTLTFTDSPFTSYTTVVKGDTINITGGTGVTPGSYIILTRIDANNITIGSRVGRDGFTVSGTSPPAVSDSSVTISGGWYLTLTKCQTLHDAAGANADIAFLFKNGETWKDVSTKSNTITSSAGATVTTNFTSVTTVSGSRIVSFSGATTGALVGATVTGTNIAANSVIEAIDRDTITGTHSFTLNNACTGSGTVTVTQTTYTFQLTALGANTPDGYPYASNMPNLGIITLTGGTPTTTRLLNCAPGTGVVIVGSVDGSTHTGVQWTNQVSLIFSKKNLSVGAFGPNISGRKPLFTNWTTFSTNSTSKAYLGVSTGAFTSATWTASTKTLTKTGAFASYTWASGDTCTVSSGTGATIGVYTVASKVNSDSITLDVSPGADASDYSIANVGTELEYTYALSVTEYVASVRNQNSKIPWRQVFSIQDVNANNTFNDQGRWYQAPDTKILYMSAPANQAMRTTTGGFAGNGQAYEYAIESQFPLFYLATGSDNVRYDGCESSGFGLNTGLLGTFTGNTYHIKGTVNTVDGSGAIATPANGGLPQVAVVSNWEANFTYYHIVGILGSYGGCTTYYNVVYGFGDVTADLVTYAAGGRNESLLYYVQCLGSQMPVGPQPYATGNSGSANLCHSSLQTYTATGGNWSGNSITLTNVATGVNGDDSDPGIFAVGRSLTMTTAGGGSPLTRTISGFNPTTGIVTFSSSMDGTTRTTFNVNIDYPVTLYIVYYPLAVRSANMCQNFSPPANGLVFSTIDGCRGFVINDRYERRDSMETDTNPVEMAITATGRGDKSLTLTTKVPLSQIGSANNTFFFLCGPGTSSQKVRYTAYSASTGALTLDKATPARIAGCTYIRFPITSAANAQPTMTLRLGGGDYPASSQGTGLQDACYINGHYYAGSLFTQNPGGGAICANSGAIQGADLVNCTVVVDNTNTFNSGSGQTLQCLANAPGFFARWFNCEFYFKNNARTIAGIDQTAVASGSVTGTTVVAYNCIFAGDIDNNSTVLDNYGTASNFGIGLGNDFSIHKHNAVYNANLASGKAGYDTDTLGVVLEGVPPIDQFPTTDSPLVDLNNQQIDGNTLQYAQNWDIRTSNAIGPLDPIQTFPGTANGQGVHIARAKGNNFMVASTRSKVMKGSLR